MTQYAVRKFRYIQYDGTNAQAVCDMFANGIDVFAVESEADGECVISHNGEYEQWTFVTGQVILVEPTMPGPNRVCQDMAEFSEAYSPLS